MKQEYLQKASDASSAYQKAYQVYTEKSESIHDRIDEIKARGDMSTLKSKFISPYRVFKRDTAAAIKEEFPNMKSQERQVITKLRWKSLTDKEKALFVAKARIEEAKLHYQ